MNTFRYEILSLVEQMNAYLHTTELWDILYVFCSYAGQFVLSCIGKISRANILKDFK